MYLSPYAHDLQLAEVKPDKIICKDSYTGEAVEISCDAVILAMGVRSRWELADELHRCAP